VVGGGPGNDPSVDRLVEGIEGAAAEAVIVLANHESVVPLAETAAARATKVVRIVASPSIPSGLAAATAFNPLAEAEENVPGMKEAAEACGWGEVARADRGARTSAGPVGRGDWVGTVRGEVVSAGGSPCACGVEVVRRLAAEDAELITVIVGAQASPDERQALQGALEQAFPGLEVQVLDGGQPRDPFLIGVE
jgi:fatty acid kinase